MPALFTRTSIRPDRLSAAWTMCSNESARDRSAGWGINRPASPSADFATAPSASAARSTASTSIPLVANPSAIARPMPLAAPVTIAVLRSLAMFFSSRVGFPGVSQKTQHRETGQRVIITGRLEYSSTCRVTPPRISCRKRE